MRTALQQADVFIGVSKGNLLTAQGIRSMADKAIIWAMANPNPEVMPQEAFAGGAAVVGTGRSNFPNQVNNVLDFPGLFRDALDAGASGITEATKWAATDCLAAMVDNPSADCILPDPSHMSVAPKISHAVAQAALND